MPLVDDSMDESTPWLIENLKGRYLSTQSGFIIDNQTSNYPVWCVSTSAFDKWFSELESVIDQTLGRRLAYASAESEEMRWSLAPPLPKTWFGQQKKRIGVLNADWAMRGLGQLEILETTNEGATLLVANRGHTSIAAGMANAGWECVQENRFRFQWSDRGAGETVVQTTSDPRNIPTTNRVEIPWCDTSGEVTDEERIFHRARHETDGVWTIEGNRSLMIYRDLLIRFESLTIPYLADTQRSTDSRTDWVGIEEPEKIVLWDAMAEAARKQFLASGELVLVANPEHWITVSNRHLAMQGLGCVSNATGIDGNGGVDLHLPAVFHPAIVIGRLIGCWERAEGRAAKATWSTQKDGHHIKIESRREIAELSGNL
jgi:hypothetical protein